MGNNNLQFESHIEAGALIDNYDSASDNWSFPQDGDFWDAVKEAQRNGFRGQNKRIAIIDGAFDLKIPKLAAQAKGSVYRWAKPSENTNHGTAVSLLISTVAPESRFDLYEVAEDGKPSRHLVMKALDLASKSDAMIINLSLGRRVQTSNWWWRLWKGNEHCELCLAASNTASQGKLVIASVGNAEGEAFCPARNNAILGIGFQMVKTELIKTSEGGWCEIARAIGPSYPQAFTPDYTLMQPAGVLGSSFAAPLISGAIALIDDPSDVRMLVRATQVGAMAALMHNSLQPSSPREEEVELVKSLYSKALSQLPHRHHGAEEGPPCVACSLLAQSLYVNAGLFALNTYDFVLAEDLLRAARWLVPRSPHAAANLATLLRVKAEMLLEQNRDIDESLPLLQAARDEYLCALKLRPDFKSYVSGLKIVDDWISRLSDIRN